MNLIRGTWVYVMSCFPKSSWAQCPASWWLGGPISVTCALLLFSLSSLLRRWKRKSYRKAGWGPLLAISSRLRLCGSCGDRKSSGGKFPVCYTQTGGSPCHPADCESHGTWQANPVASSSGGSCPPTLRLPIADLRFELPALGNMLAPSPMAA